MVEYSKQNKFPFYTSEKMVSISFDNHEDIYELDFIYNKIVDRFPNLQAENFYTKVSEINQMTSDDKMKCMKVACDKLLTNIRTCLSDETFIHALHDKWGFGIDKVIGTLYAVYGYYFYTGKRTANVIKKTLDAYKRKPIH